MVARVSNTDPDAIKKLRQHNSLLSNRNRKLEADYGHVKAQRDALLAACEAAMSWSNCIGASLYQYDGHRELTHQLQAAIANLTNDQNCEIM